MAKYNINYGIDLGTTNSCMAIIEVGEHEANSYDLVVGANETISALTSQSLKSMNR